MTCHPVPSPRLATTFPRRFRLLLPLAWTIAFLAFATAVRAQLDFPALSNIRRESAAVVRPGDTVIYRFTAIPGTAAIASIRFYFSTEAGSVIRTLGTEDAASGRVSGEMDAAWVDESYRLFAIKVVDAWGRAVDYGREGTVSGSAFTLQRIGYYTGATSHAVDFAELGFAVRGGSTARPRTELTDIALLTTSPVSPGQAVRYRTSGVPGAVPLAKITFSLGLGTSSNGLLAFTADATSPNAEYSFTLPGGLMNGPYRLLSVSTTDREGRIMFYPDPGTLQTVRESVEAYSYSTDLVVRFPAAFDVAGGSTSNPLPRLVVWERESPAEVGPGALVSFNVAAEGGSFPVQQISLQLTGPYGAARMFTVEGASGRVTVPVTADWLSGPYSIGVVTLIDAAGRRVNYLPLGGSPFLGGTIISGSPFPPERFTFDVRGGRDVRPYFVIQPEPRTFIRDRVGFVTLSALVSDSAPTATYRWYRGDVGDTRQPLPSESFYTNLRRVEIVTRLGAEVTGPATFWVRAVVNGQTVDSHAAEVLPRPDDFGRLTNLSLLTDLADASDSVTLGFVVGGRDTSGPKQILARAAGPALAAFGIQDFATNPRLQLFAGTALLVENDDWGGAAALSAGMAAVGAFPYPAATSRDAAALATTAAGGNHSVRVSGGAGRVLAELYDLGPYPATSPTAARLANVSVLKQIREGFTVGFSVAGSSPTKVLLRAVGPSLSEQPFNLAGVVADPRIVLYRGDTPLAVSDDWSESGNAISNAFSEVGAFSIGSFSKDAVLLRELAPGSYTVQVRSNRGGGLVLVEVYEVP